MKKLLALAGLFLLTAIAPLHTMEKKTPSLVKPLKINLSAATLPLLVCLKKQSRHAAKPSVKSTINYTCLECKEHYTSLFGLKYHACPQRKTNQYVRLFFIQSFAPEIKIATYELNVPQPPAKDIDQTTLLSMQENEFFNEFYKKSSLKNGFDSSVFFK